MDTYNGLNDSHGQSISGYTWQVDIDTYLILSENEVYVEGTIFHSNVKQDIGSRTGFYVYDGGPGGTDYIQGTPVLKGNFDID